MLFICSFTHCCTYSPSPDPDPNPNLTLTLTLAQVVLGVALYTSLEEAAAAGEEHDACLELVRCVLRSELCKPRFVDPLLEDHPLSAGEPPP